MIFAHAFVGIILAHFIVNRLELIEKVSKHKQKLVLWCIFILASIFPDIDIMYVLFVNPWISHRLLLTHNLVFYFFLGFLAFLSIKMFNLSKGYLSYVVAFMYGVTFHVIFDMFAESIYPFRPFYNEAIQFPLFDFDKSGGLAAYFKSSYMVMEFSIILVATLILINTFKNFNKELKFFLGLSGIILVLALVTILPFLHRFN